jgi:hypothetical protein
MTKLLEEALRRVEPLSPEERWRSTGAAGPVRWTNCWNEVVHLAAVPRDVRESSGGGQSTRQPGLQIVPAQPKSSRPQLQEVDNQNQIYSARVGLGYRALGQMDGQDIVWFWIGPYTDYDKLL